ncbi:MAG: isoprenylcysteine carboxylmethyltransferase family protein [Thermoanaerobaculia bacterium]
MVKQLFLGLRSVVVSSLFVLLWWWLATLVRRYDRNLGVSIPAGFTPLGWILAVAGGLFAAWCVFTFATRGQGTPAPFDPPRRFVASGPYRFVRNPMYVGGLGLLAGGGLSLRSPAILLLAGAGWLLSHLFVITYEEPVLESSFGDSYREYKARVHRWLPRWP